MLWYRRLCVSYVIDLLSECMILVAFVFFKQKTAYEMRISDWSSDVCSSDLHPFDGNILLDWRGRVDRNQCHLARSVARLDDLHQLAAVLGLHHAFAAVAFGGVQPFVARVSEMLAVLEAGVHRAAAHHAADPPPFALPDLAPVRAPPPPA